MLAMCLCISVVIMDSIYSHTGLKSKQDTEKKGGKVFDYQFVTSYMNVQVDTTLAWYSLDLSFEVAHLAVACILYGVCVYPCCWFGGH